MTLDVNILLRGVWNMLEDYWGPRELLAKLRPLVYFVDVQEDLTWLVRKISRHHLDMEMVTNIILRHISVDSLMWEGN